VALLALRRDIVSHEYRVYQLREAIRLAEEEIALHEILLDLAGNDQLITAIGDLYNADLSSGFVRDPHKYCSEQGISIPEGVRLNPVDMEGPSPRLTADVRSGPNELQVIWDRDEGFFVRGFSPRVFVT